MSFGNNKHPIRQVPPSSPGCCNGILISEEMKAFFQSIEINAVDVPWTVTCYVIQPKAIADTEACTFTPSHIIDVNKRSPAKLRGEVHGDLCRLQTIANCVGIRYGGKYIYEM